MKLYKGLPWMKYRSPNNTVLLGKGWIQDSLVMLFEMNWKNLIHFLGRPRQRDGPYNRCVT